MSRSAKNKADRAWARSKGVSPRATRSVATIYSANGWRVCAAVAVDQSAFRSEYGEAFALQDEAGGSFLVYRQDGAGDRLAATLPDASVVGMWLSANAGEIVEDVGRRLRGRSASGLLASAAPDQVRQETFPDEIWDGASAASVGNEIDTETPVEIIDGVLGGASASRSVFDDEYQGEIARFGRKFRLIVNASFRSFVVQERHKNPSPRGPWVNVKGGSSTSVRGLLQRCAAPGLRRAVKGLPDRPRDAAPEFVRFRSAQSAAFALTDWRADDYPRLLMQRGDWRVVVDPDGETLRVLRSDRDGEGPIGIGGWLLVKHLPSVPDARAWLAGGSDQPDKRRLADALRFVSDELSDVSLAPLPVRPSTPSGRSRGR